MIERSYSQGCEVKICWVIALEPEARPLIDLFDLSPLSSNLNFPVYINPKSGHALVMIQPENRHIFRVFDSQK